MRWAISLSQHSGGLTPPLTSAAGQHALFAIGAGGAGPLAAILAAAGVAGEFRHRTAAATFLATPRRAQVIAAKLVTYLLAGAGYGLACASISVALALPWLAARGIHLGLASQGNLAVLGAVIISAALFAVSTLRSYAGDLLLWFLRIGWDRASRVEARDFSCWIQLTAKQRLQTSRPRAARLSSRTTGAPNAVTGKPAAGDGYAPSTVAHSVSVTWNQAGETRSVI